MNEIKPAYAGEAMLVRWAENHNGRTVTLQLDPDIGEIHPFKGLKGGLNGQRMQLAAVLIDENDQPQCPQSTEPDSGLPVVPSESAGEGQDTRRTPFKDKHKSVKAAIKCQDHLFQTWLGGDEYIGRDLWTEALLKKKLGISSKTELDTNPDKAAAWSALLTDFDNKDRVR